MKLTDILANIKEKLGIAALKPMQAQVAECQSERLRLAAPTGSGKTIAFVIYALKRIGASGRGVQVVVLAPSRELALQIYSVMRPVASGYKTVVLYGGHSMEDEKNSLSPVPDIVIATPGRMLDHINRGNIDVSTVRVLVLDEYDKCVELGFEGEMKRIVQKMRGVRSIALTSATSAMDLPQYLPQDGWHTFDFAEGAGASQLQLVRVQSPAVDKADTLAALLCSIPERKVIVFVNHRESAERVRTFLKKAGIAAGLYHGGLEQHDRAMAVELLDNGTVDVLVATDLAARGLDIAGIEAVVHYHIPPTVENWIHRNGRTARNGASGTVYTITSEADNIPEYVEWTREYAPKPGDGCRRGSGIATLHFNAGRKEKISKGDIAGFLITRGGLGADEVGRISVHDHEALAAVPAAKIREVIKAVEPFRLKNKKVRITQVRV